MRLFNVVIQVTNGALLLQSTHLVTDGTLSRMQLRSKMEPTKENGILPFDIISASEVHIADMMDVMERVARDSEPFL